MFNIKKLYPSKWNVKRITLVCENSKGQEKTIEVDTSLEVFDLSKDIESGFWATLMILESEEKNQLYQLQNNFQFRNKQTLKNYSDIKLESEELQLEQDQLYQEIAVRDEYIEKLERMYFHAKKMAEYYAGADYSSTMESSKHIVRDSGQLANNYMDLVESFEKFDPHHLGFGTENKEGSLK